ncbi:unnamed protein product, partial [Rotaria magnacalcarata]
PKDRLRKSTSSSVINRNSHSPTVLSSINNSRSNNNLLGDDELEMETDIVSVGEFSTQKQITDENLNPMKYPSEIDKGRLQKKTTSSGKKLADEVYQLFEKEGDGNYKCTLCTDKIKKILDIGKKKPLSK